MSIIIDMQQGMEENKTTENTEYNTVAVCSFCRHHQRNPSLEFNFSDAKIYFMCTACMKMNCLDLSKPSPTKYPKPRGL